MGSIFRFEHKTCGFEYKHFDGSGFSGMELERQAYEKINNGDMGEEWKTLLDEKPAAEITVCNELSYCEACKKYLSIPQIKLSILEEKNGEEERIVLIKEKLYCPKCKKETVVLDNMFAVPCPVCGEKIKGEFAGLWE